MPRRALDTTKRRDGGLSSESPCGKSGSSSGEIVRQLQVELATLTELLKAEKDREDKAESEIASLRDEVAAAGRLKVELQREKEKYKQVWRMNCEQLAEYDGSQQPKMRRWQLCESSLSGRTGNENHSWTRNRGGRSNGRSRDCWHPDGCHSNRGIWGKKRVVSCVAEERESPTR